MKPSTAAGPALDGLHLGHPLERVVWNALHGPQRALALRHGKACRYPSAIARFGAVADEGVQAHADLHALVEQHGPTALITTAEHGAPGELRVLRQERLLQMLRPGAPERPATLQFEVLSSADVPAMLELVAITEPGPFGARTLELGRYLGVRREGRLVAMAGERMRLDGFAEISAVCVDPAYRGQGLAAELMRCLIGSMAADSQIPFLHVFDTNASAIALYRRLGFVERSPMWLTVLGLDA